MHARDNDDLHLPVVVFSTWRQMADSPPRRPPRKGRKNATKPARAVPVASARQHLDVETQAGAVPDGATRRPSSVWGAIVLLKLFFTHGSRHAPWPRLGRA